MVNVVKLKYSFEMKTILINIAKEKIIKSTYNTLNKSISLYQYTPNPLIKC